MTRFVLLLAAGLACAGPALAQHAGHGAPAPSTPPQAAQDRATGGDGDRQGRAAGGSPSTPDPATTAFQAANERMHHAMAAPPTGETNVDFARGMVAHHQGAVDMAKVMLQYGRDPELRKLAQDIVASQEKEIAFLQDWLRRAGK
ncbi:MAG: hypothetical protein AVDCRST_MAG90-1844 [uncultured Microvirga sp.]|uniref:DUF305 domain-containing protein n=1 Tax=uncultured Microvirga sp. TaxID=412392 RepID=A0A6J4LTQ8_9HYPH|nr:MAG: hypothetical protein AVDCRST_MAG90-1844 [uncultured Microvirga sp.]